MSIDNLEDFFKEKEFVVNQGSILHSLLKEDKNYIPRFSFKDIELFNELPVNEPIKFSNDVIIKAIKYGLIMLVNYRGAYDKHIMGHERVLYPLVLGKSSKGKQLLRGYHLTGWSVSANNHIDKAWRMFRTDRVLSMTFTGSFFRLAPEGYQPNDKGMRGGIIANADFDEIRRNQEKLVKQEQIQDKEEISIEKKSTIIIENTDTIVDIKNFTDNPIVSQIDDLDNLRVSFLKSVYGNKYIAVLGALGKVGSMVKVKETVKPEKKYKKLETLGNYKVLDSAIGRDLKKIKNVKGNSKFDLYKFVEKK